jgi:hypothetical protein
MYDYVRIPYSESSGQPNKLTLKEENELCELKSDPVLKMSFTDLSLNKFWISVKEQCLAIHKKAIYMV